MNNMHQYVSTKKIKKNYLHCCPAAVLMSGHKHKKACLSPGYLEIFFKAK